MRLFRSLQRSNNEAVIERIHSRIVEAARRRELFTSWEIPDTFEGRFDSLTLHSALVLRRLRNAEQPGPEMAQHLTDIVFTHFEVALREMGVGDTSVPKRMKGLAEAFLGRQNAYDAALIHDRREGGTLQLAAALSRNIYNGVGSHAAGLAHYARASVDALEDTSLQALIDGSVPFADPALFTSAPRS